MHQRFALWLGTGMLILAAVFLAGFGPGVLAEPAIGVSIAGFVVAALLAIVGGTVESIAIGSRTVPWNVLVGASNVVMALAAALSSVSTFATGGSGTTATLIAIGMVIGCASLAWGGLQTARDSRHVDLEASPSAPRLAGIAVLTVVSIGVGAFLVTVI